MFWTESSFEDYGPVPAPPENSRKLQKVPESVPAPPESSRKLQLNSHLVESVCLSYQWDILICPYCRYEAGLSPKYELVLLPSMRGSQLNPILELYPSQWAQKSSWTLKSWARACSSTSSSFCLLEAAGSTFSGVAGTFSGGYWRSAAGAAKLWYYCIHSNFKTPNAQGFWTNIECLK